MKTADILHVLPGDRIGRAAWKIGKIIRLAILRRGWRAAV